MTPSEFEVSGKSGAARRYYKKNPDRQSTIRAAIVKICENPFRDHRPHAIRRLKGDWRGYLEYRIRNPLLRIIYRISDRQSRHIYIEEIDLHL